MNKYTILFAMLLFVVSLSSCGRVSTNKEVLLLSKSNYKLYYFTSNLKTVTESISDSVFYKEMEFWHSTVKKDKRPYSFKVCRTNNNTLNDTIKLITVNPYNRTYEFGNYESFTLLQFYRNKTQNLGKNYPSSNEFTNYLKSIQSNDYFELLPNQECIEIPIKD